MSPENFKGKALKKSHYH